MSTLPPSLPWDHFSAVSFAVTALLGTAIVLGGAYVARAIGDRHLTHTAIGLVATVVATTPILRLFVWPTIELLEESEKDVGFAATGEWFVDAFQLVAAAGVFVVCAVRNR